MIPKSISRDCGYTSNRRIHGEKFPLRVYVILAGYIIDHTHTQVLSILLQHGYVKHLYIVWCEIIYLFQTSTVISSHTLLHVISIPC